MNAITKMMKSCINSPLKKMLPLVLISAILFVSITGCTQQQTTSSIGNSSAPAAGTAAAGTAAAGGSNQVVNGISATATQVAVPSPLSGTPKLGKFVAFDCTVKNVNANLRYVGTEYWTVRDASGRVYYPAGVSYLLGNRFGPATTNPGDVVKGTVIFDVPQNAHLKSLTYNDYAFSKVTLTL